MNDRFVDRWGFVRRPTNSERDRTDELVFAAKQAVAAVSPRRVMDEVLEWAVDGGDAKLRRQVQGRKRFRKRKPVDPDGKVSHSDQSVLDARKALAALPRQALRDDVVAWALEMGLGSTQGHSGNVPDRREL